MHIESPLLFKVPDQVIQLSTLLLPTSLLPHQMYSPSGSHIWLHIRISGGTFKKTKHSGINFYCILRHVE